MQADTSMRDKIHRRR